MFNSERLLGHLLRGTLRGSMGGGDSNWATKAGVGMGILGVAMAAFEHFSEQSQAAGGPSTRGGPSVPPPLPGGPTTPPPPPPPVPSSLAPEPTVSSDPASLMIRAMIAAANADGEIDSQERARILRAAEESGLPEDDVNFLQAELDRPWSLRQVADQATSPELRKQLYVASRMAISVDTEAERRYLQALSVALYLTTAEVAQLEAQLGE